MNGIMGVESFLQVAVILITIGVMALVALYAPRWVFKVIVIASGLVLTAYATSVLLVNIPLGIPNGSLPLLGCFLGGAIWTKEWSRRFWETRNTAA